MKLRGSSAPSSRSLRWLLAILLLSGLPLAGAFARLLPSVATRIAPTGSDPFFNLFILEWGAQSWTRALVGFWDAPFFFPSPLATTLSDHLLLPSLLHLGLRTVGATPALAYNILMLSAFSLTSAACFLLIRTATRCPRWAAAILALAIVYAPWRWGQLTHFQMLWAPGPPLALLTFDRLVRRGGRKNFLWFLLAYLVTLGSSCYLAYFTHVTLGIVFLLHFVRAPARLVLRWRLLVAAGIVCVATATLIFYPYVSARSVLKASRKNAEIHKFGARATDWLAPSGMNQYASFLPPEWRHAERNLFPGVLLSLGAIAAAALAMSQKMNLRRTPLLGQGLLWAGLLFAILSNSRVFVLVARFLPGFDGMRVPTRAEFFVLIGLACFVGIGLKKALLLTHTVGVRNALALACSILLAVELMVHPLAAGTLFEPERTETLPPHVAAVARSSAAAIAVFPLEGTSGEIPRMWRALWHKKPVANGFSGYLAPSFRYLRHSCRSPGGRMTSRCVSALRTLDISALVIEDSFRGLSASDLEGRLSSSIHPEARGELKLEYSDSDVLLLRIPLTQSEKRTDGFLTRR